MSTITIFRKYRIEFGVSPKIEHLAANEYRGGGFGDLVAIITKNPRTVAGHVTGVHIGYSGSNNGAAFTVCAVVPDTFTAEQFVEDFDTLLAEYGWHVV